MKVPTAVGELTDVLARSAGVVAVVVGGSRGQEATDAHSDWDLGVYYRGDIDLMQLQRFGEVHPPGSWGRIMNGGAWLVIDGVKVDVLLRDVDVVEYWCSEARQGRYDVDGLLGYVAGIPTYSLMAEVAGAKVVAGTLALDADFPSALAQTAPLRWRIHRDFSLMYATAHAQRGNVVGAVGQCTKAVFEEAHARRCERASWALNEKRLLLGCHLDGTSDVLAAFGRTSEQQEASVQRISALLLSG